MPDSILEQSLIALRVSFNKLDISSWPKTCGYSNSELIASITVTASLTGVSS